VKQLSSDGFLAAAIHGNKSQGARTKALAEFKAGKVQVLVATDIAARGLDIDKLPYVINYDLPQVAEDYVHRIGRTGRAGQVGHAISLVMDEEFKTLKAIERLIGQPIERRQLEGFAPVELTGKTPPPARGQRPPRNERKPQESRRPSRKPKPAKR